VYLKKHAENAGFTVGRTHALKSGAKMRKLKPVKISIVVPAFNEERLLAGSLAQMKSAAAVFARRGWEVELVVCDNNSTDRTAEIARNAGAQVVFEPINQIARARNRGADAATGDWLIFVDADSHPSAELFDAVANEIQSGTCLAGGATMRLDQKYLVAELIVPLWNLASRWRRLLAGAFIFIEKSAFVQVRGFSNELFVGEELELSQRLKKLADQTGKRMVIIHRYPMVTSARKLQLYTLRQHLAFLVCVLFNPYRAMTSREKAHLWYDGRR
jgi:glycosyltransferase involved in cell wall biosynthesis